jgi:hypothetical protein
MHIESALERNWREYREPPVKEGDNRNIILYIFNNTHKTKLNSVALVRERTIPITHMLRNSHYCDGGEHGVRMGKKRNAFTLSVG